MTQTAELARAYVSAFRVGRMAEALELVSPDLVRVAPLESGGKRVELHGLEAVMANGERLNADLEIHAVEVDGPFVDGDRFVVRFTFDETRKSTGERMTNAKMCLYWVSEGRIVREEVYYFDPVPGLSD
jgi:ketosteroid isomerase-like protein